MNSCFANCWLWFKKQSPVASPMTPLNGEGVNDIAGSPMGAWCGRHGELGCVLRSGDLIVAAGGCGCSSRYRFVLSTITDPPLEAILYFPSMTVPKHPACTWGRCDWFSPLYWFLGGDCQHFTSVYKTSTKLTHSGTGTVLLTVRSRGICSSSCCATLWLSSPSHGSWWQIRWTGAFSTSTPGCSAAIFCVCGEFWQSSTRLFTNREGKNNSSDSPLTLIACIKLSQTTCLLEAAQLIIWSKN